MKAAWCGAAMLAALAALPAQAQQPAPLPADKPPCCATPQPDWYVQRKCPETADCMPGPDSARAERCAWLKANCPNTNIAY